MTSHYDYLSIERHLAEEGSHMGDVKALVEGIRFVRERIPAEQIKEHMPPLWALENKLNGFLDTIGEQRRQFIEEIMVALDNEPQPDPTTKFHVCEVLTTEMNWLELIDSENVFDQNILAEEWIKESASVGKKYTVLKILERPDAGDA